MEQLILVLTGLGLGFWQGLKKRNKKHRNQIAELNDKNIVLENKLSEMKRKERLRQFSNGNLQKKVKEKMETDLVEFSTSSDVNYKMTLVTYSLIAFVFRQSGTNIKDQFVNSNNIQKEIEDYIEQSELDDDNVDILINFPTGKRFVTTDFCYKEFIKFIGEFSIDDYEVTNNEMLELMDFILFRLDD